MVSVLVLSWALGVTAASEPEAAKPPGPDLVAYEAAKAGAGRDADAHVALALWCEAHGMPAEKATHLARAVLIDPSHAKARGLLGYVKHEGKWLRPEDVTRAVEDSPESQALFREYQERRTQARDKADDQFKLARWCDEHGLAQQATAHYHRVIELDPGRDLAWRHLGFKKKSGRWIKPEALAAAKAEVETQSKADKLWKAAIEHIKDSLASRDKARRAQALEGLGKIKDPRAVPMVWSGFAQGDERSQYVAVGIFAQIDAPGASRALATMAVCSPISGVRAEASRRLLGRDPRDFADLLAGFLKDEVKYKTKQVSGPGSQGELLVEGKDANVKRLYTPLGLPQIGLAPGDRLGFDASGMLVADRLIGPARALETNNGVGTFYTLPQLYKMREAQMRRGMQPLGLPAKQTEELVQRFTNDIWIAPNALRVATFEPNAASLATGPIEQDHLQIPVGRMNAEAQASAAIARRQLAQDVQQIEGFNASVREVNERATAILKNVSGQDLGADAGKWTAWAVDLQGYAFRTENLQSPPPTVLEEVPLDYQPQAYPVVTTQVVGEAIVLRQSCFAGGTLVRTLQGVRPIEKVELGDQVLAQDTSNGTLKYRPVVTAFHNPPNETYRLDLGKESIVATGIHRFWKAGHGWIMAREIKPGDRLRTIGGAAEVVAVTKDRVQPVFNLQLDGGDDFCVGALGVIAHDNSFVNPVERPFDGVPALADLAAPNKP
ncbi:MAG: polymorphic toxin-type HINT domain-containing protein [Paludisphaera borealis]|uniref:polymorphic toxin-type HINT domain-containing protein n=1 Tax=Paludisphaera borealis TaxID=1387353 RepID=UPI00283BA39B|nr:polymorphic toxin-type HINT domain-containing protein [Paludisphaera borealis]MDR3622746.1 polymorphic toxin-type HINT domain-containing protein [Paludisphaera borealis]